MDELVEKIFLHKGASGEWRHNRNNLVFVLAEASSISNMRARMLRRIALDSLRAPEKLKDLADYQAQKIQELFERSKQELALAVQQCYRHIFYPSRNRLEGSNCDLAHTVVDIQTASDRPGDGQKQIVTQLQAVSKLRIAGDQPDSPTYVRDRTPLKKGQITTAALRGEFRQDPSLPMLTGDDIFIRGIRNGIDQGEYVYQSGELVRGKGDPFAEIKIDEQSLVFTAAYARENGIWPRRIEPQPPGAGPVSPPPSGPTGDPFPPGGGEPLKVRETAIEAQDVLKAALAQVFELAAQKGVKAFATMTIRPFDKSDAMKMLPLVKSVPNATKRIELTAAYETKNGSSAELTFKGDLDDAGPLKEYLEPQFRAAADSDASVAYFLTFEPPLVTKGDPAQRLVERLTRLVSPAAHVIAIPHENT